MNAKKLIQGGRVWSEQSGEDADLLIGADGRIEEVIPRPYDHREKFKNTKRLDVLDAKNLWVLPGGVDAHVHFRQPGLTHKEDFDTGSQGALLGGVTTVLDMPNTIPPVVDGASLRHKKEEVAGRSYVDYGFFGAAVAGKELDELIERVHELVQEGAVGIKVLLGPTTGNLRAPGWGDLYHMARLAQVDVPYVFHCEDRSVIETSLGQVPADLFSTYQGLLTARPKFGELMATESVARLARETGISVHIAHVALREAVSIIEAAKREGCSITAETGPQYLLLTEDDYDVSGDVMNVLPPIRSAADQQALWQGLTNGTLDMVATDHAPHEPLTSGPRHIWDGNFGMAGVQTLLPLLLDRAIHGACTVEEVVRWTSFHPARTFGLYPRKGTLRPGADADVTIVDPVATWCVDRPWWKSKSDKTAFWKKTGLGKPVTTLLRGNVVMRNDRVTGRPKGVFLTGS